MNKTKIGIFLSLMLVLGFCSSCKEQKSNNKLLLNEVLVNNESNYQDDYGVHSAWIEICLLYTSPSPRDRQKSRMPSSA